MKVQDCIETLNPGPLSELSSIGHAPRPVNQCAARSHRWRFSSMTERSFLTARWTDLLLLNFTVPVDLIARVAPPGTEPDLHDGQAYISIVGFHFHNVRILGVPIPGHTRFDEINLRYYVKRVVGNDTRRGVVFVREIVPRRAVTLIANRLYYENYITRPMRSAVSMTGSELRTGDTLEYAWSTKTPLPVREGQGEGSSSLVPARSVSRPHHWNRLAARVAAPLAIPTPASLHEFIVEHYWGYSRARDGRTREYRVSHSPWRVAAADNVTWDCDLAATYDSAFAEYLAAPPTGALVADGSAVQVFRGRRV